MADIIYNRFIYLVNNHTIDLTSSGTVVRALLERSTSTYSPDKDHDYVSDLTSLVEISVSGYARITATTKAVSLDDTNDRALWDFDDLDFGTLASGQSVKSLILYQQTGGNDSSPSDDPLICRIDSIFSPYALGGGDFKLVLNAAGLMKMVQP